VEGGIKKRYVTRTGETHEEMLERVAREYEEGSDPPCRLSIHVLFREDGSQTIIQEVFYWALCYNCGAQVRETNESEVIAVCKDCRHVK